ncbi:hypothetical protein NW762_001693 [Fusarium torreyae]|uniref:Uncharacterized protein n=1 Tax=Fusarium torreyae TaxID=1237075 RepID=A0A9W8VNP0_9HYPO|nr:hypothetical protein NW762_001693 [Fusarium torreyae]
MPALPPSATIPSRHLLSVRQNDDSSTSFTAVPTAYKNVDDSLAPGVVAGIVLGSVAGFLLILYLIYMLLHRGPVVANVDGASTVVSGAPMSSVTGDTSTYLSFRSRRDRRTQHRSRSRATSKSKRTRSRATTDQSRDRSRRRSSPLVGDSRGSRVIVDPPAPRYAQESTISSDNEIVVEEEHSVSPPRRSRRQSEDRYRREPLMGDRYGPRDYSPRDYSPRRDSRRYSRGR